MGGAVIQDSFGGSEVLEVRDVKEPQTAPGEVRVRVSAAALNPVDWKLDASAEIARRFGVTVSAGSGGDFAGVVDEVGDGVTRDWDATPGRWNASRRRLLPGSSSCRLPRRSRSSRSAMRSGCRAPGTCTARWVITLGRF
jgi:NADPH:quinone reductase-like Zn-dependent oxidoreductase